jgi:hypothetical protein
MKKALFCRLTGTILGLFLVCGMGLAQTVTTTTAQTRTLTDGTTSPVATETPDLVTVGTLVPYLVIPDKDINPSYVLATDGASTTNVSSTFNWTVTGLGTITNASPKHYIELNITGTAGTTVTMNVKEQNSASGACADATGTNINVKILAQPTVTAASVNPASVCSADGTTAITLPQFSITSTSDVTSPSIKVYATLHLTPLSGAASDIFADQELAVDASGNVTLPAVTLTKWGKYTLTISKVSDKISRKDIDATRKGYFAVSSISTDFYIYKTPKTGAIYHISNAGL